MPEVAMMGEAENASFLATRRIQRNRDQSERRPSRRLPGNDKSDVDSGKQIYLCNKKGIEVCN